MENKESMKMISFAVVEVLKSDFFNNWSKIKEFEEELCRYTNAKYCVAVANGTTKDFNLFCFNK